MRESPRSAPLVPSRHDVQAGYDLAMRTLELEGCQVRLFGFPERPPAPAPTLVCLPGLGASGRSFAPMRPLATSLDLMLWSPPLSTPLGTTPLELNLSLLSHPSAPLPPRFSLLGSSYGSLLALAFALRFPERLEKLVLVSPVASLRRVRRWALTLSTLVRVPLPFAWVLAPAVARILGGRQLPSPARAEIVREARRLTPLEVLRRLRDILMTDLTDALSQLRIPTLVLHGARDSVVPLRAARDVAARIPGSRLEVLREAAHLPYMSHPDSFNAFVGDFLLSPG